MMDKYRLKAPETVEGWRSGIPHLGPDYLDIRGDKLFLVSGIIRADGGEKDNGISGHRWASIGFTVFQASDSYPGELVSRRYLLRLNVMSQTAVRLSTLEEHIRGVLGHDIEGVLGVHYSKRLTVVNYLRLEGLVEAVVSNGRVTQLYLLNAQDAQKSA